MNPLSQQQPAPDQPPGGKRTSSGRAAGVIMIVIGAIIGLHWLFPNAHQDLFRSLGSSVFGILITGLGIFFIVRELTPNRKKPYRIGRITTGVVFLWAGIGLSAASVIPAGWFSIVSKLWPIVLIGYGVEYLVRRPKGAITKLDISGLFLIVLVCIITTGAQIDRLYSVMVDRHGYSVQDAPIVITPSRIGSLQLEANAGNITIVPADNEKVTITPTYRSYKEQSLQALKQKSKMDIEEENGNITVSMLSNKASDGIRFEGIYDYSVDLQIAVPAEMRLDVTAAIGKIAVTGHNNVHKLQTDVGIIDMTNVQGTDTRLQIAIGKINVEQYRGKLTAAADIGMIEVDGEPTDDWSLNTSIGYLGTKLPRNGNYQFDMNVEVGKTDYPANTSAYPSNDSPQIRMNVDIGQAVANFRQ